MSQWLCEHSFQRQSSKPDKTHPKKLPWEMKMLIDVNDGDHLNKNLWK